MSRFVGENNIKNVKVYDAASKESEAMVTELTVPAAEKVVKLFVKILVV